MGFLSSAIGQKNGLSALEDRTFGGIVLAHKIPRAQQRSQIGQVIRENLTSTHLAFATVFQIPALEIARPLE